MRNLKRALSLTLASVMLLGMMVVGSSAAAGYDDVDEKNNIEAIEVLQEIEVMVGDERGFGPDRPVNRAEMAVVMGKLLSLDYDYYATSCPFNDVYDWARGWVGACYANKIVSGRGEGVYDPGATVTAVEAASMLMRALGYFQYANDVVDGFELSTVRQGTKIGIFDGVGSSATAPMTRDQVAKMVLNALQSDTVEPDGNTINLTTPDGTVLTGKVNYVSVTRDEPWATAIDDTRATSIGSQNSGYIVELGERLYNGDLKLYDNRKDDFGRPSRTWEYKGNAIGTYMKKELIKQEWTIGITGKDVYDLLGSDTIRDYTFDITIDGVDVGGKTGTTDHDKVLKTKASTDSPYSGGPASYFDKTYFAKTYKDTIGATGNGTLTQVFVNPDKKHVDVAVINTYLAKATTDYNDKKDEVSYNVFALDSTGSGNNEVFFKYKDACKVPKEQAKKLTVSGDDFDIKDVKKDDIVLVTEANGEIKTIAAPEVLSAVTLSAFSKNKYVVTDGTTYNYTTTTEYDVETLEAYTGESATQQLKNTDYNVYLDQYGYAIGVEVVEAAKNYIFLTGIDQAASNLRNKTAEAAGILTDGTFVQFTMNTKDSEAYWQHGNVATNKYMVAKNKVGRFGGGPLWNTWCTYTVDKDGVYTLKEVKGWDELKATDSKEKAGQSKDLSYFNKSIDSKHVSLRAYDVANTTDRYVYGNDKTVYIVPELEAIKSDTTFDIGAFMYPKAAGTSSVDGTATTVKIEQEKTYVGIIDDVDSVTTGINNVNLKTPKDQLTLVGQIDGKTGTEAAYAGVVYPLFNNDGYVIAAVVVGEDDGASKNLVYCDSDKPIEEAYSDANDEWSWQREVIYNGERTKLLEKGDKLSKLSASNMKENVWYQVTYKADGSVKDIEEAYYDEWAKRVGTDAVTPATGYDHALDRTTSKAAGDAADFVDKIDWVENAINESNKNTVLYEEVWGKVTTKATDGTTDVVNTKADGATAKTVMTVRPSLVEHTLYVDTAAQRGFYVNDDVKSVLIQKNDGQKSTSWGENASDLEGFLDDLNKDEEKGFIFKISAVLVGGHATVVVIHDWNETGAKANEDTTPSGSGTYTSAEEATGATPVADMDMSKAEIDDTMNLKVPALYMGAKVREQLEEILTSMGYKVTKTVYNDTSKTYTFSVDKDGKGMDVKCKVDDTSCITDKYYLLDNNGTKTFQKAGDTVTVTKAAADNGTGYAVTVNGTAGNTYKPYATTTYAMTAADTVIENGYVNVKKGSTSIGAAKFETDYTVPAKGSDNGTGFEWKHETDATTKGYVAYSGKIDGTKVVKDIVLTADKIKVTAIGFKAEDLTGALKDGYVAYNGGTIDIGDAAPTNLANGSKGTGVAYWYDGTPNAKTHSAYGTDPSTSSATDDITVEAGYIKLTGFDTTALETGVTPSWKVNGSAAAANMPIKAGTAVNVTATISVTQAFTAANTGADGSLEAQIDGSKDGTAKLDATVAAPNAGDWTNSETGTMTIKKGAKLAVGDKIDVTFTSKTAADANLAFSLDYTAAT